MTISPDRVISVGPSSSSAHRMRLDMHIVEDEFRTMSLQEEMVVYKCTDYLSRARDIVQGRQPNHSARNHPEPIDIECRIRMVEWCFQVIDFAELNRETVNIAMSILDRYLSTTSPSAEEVLLSRQRYQLASMSALFLAIKMNEKTVVNASVFAELSRGTYSATDIIDMEISMLATLQWRVNSPTSHLFLRYLADLVSVKDGCQFTVEASLLDLCTFQLDLSVGDYFFCTKKPSSVAIASLFNALETSPSVTNSDISAFVESLQSICGSAIYSNEILSIMERLTMLLTNNGVVLEQHHKIRLPFARRMSPVSVTGMARVVSEVSMIYHDPEQ